MFSGELDRLTFILNTDSEKPNCIWYTAPAWVYSLIDLIHFFQSLKLISHPVHGSIKAAHCFFPPLGNIIFISWDTSLKHYIEGKCIKMKWGLIMANCFHVGRRFKRLLGQHCSLLPAQNLAIKVYHVAKVCLQGTVWLWAEMRGNCLWQLGGKRKEATDNTNSKRTESPNWKLAVVRRAQEVANETFSTPLS